jgi:hypothetical protein
MPHEIIFDPTGYHSAYNSEHILELLGLPPLWALDGRTIHLPLKETFEHFYPFGLYEFKNAMITSDGVYHSPGDSDLHPYIKITRGKETFYQYDYGIVAIVQEDGSSFVTRMD